MEFKTEQTKKLKENKRIEIGGKAGSLAISKGE